MGEIKIGWTFQDPEEEPPEGWRLFQAKQQLTVQRLQRTNPELFTLLGDREDSVRDTNATSNQGKRRAQGNTQAD